MALGAGLADVTAMVLKQSARMALIGTAPGLAGMRAEARYSRINEIAPAMTGLRTAPELRPFRSRRWWLPGSRAESGVGGSGYGTAMRLAGESKSKIKNQNESCSRPGTPTW
jgi:hypothetical protein